MVDPVVTEEERLSAMAAEAAQLLKEMGPERRLAWFTGPFLAQSFPSLVDDPKVCAQITAFWQRIEDIAQAAPPAAKGIEQVLSAAGTLQVEPEVGRDDLQRWLAQDRARLLALQEAHKTTPVLPEEIRFVEATIGQLEAELAFLDAKERLGLE